MTFEDFLTKKVNFVDYLKEKNSSKNTIKSYRLDLERISNIWQNLDQLTKFETVVNLFFSNLEKSNNDAISIARRVSCVNVFCKYLKSHYNYDLPTFKRPYFIDKAPIAIAYEQTRNAINKLDNIQLNTINPIRDKFMLVLIYETGIKCTELVSLEIQDLDLKELKIKIRSKKASTRELSISKKLAGIAKEYLKNGRPNISSDKEKLFLNKNGEPTTPRSIQRVFVEFSNMIGNNAKITPNILRNSFASEIINKNESIEVAMALLGHSNVDSTQRYLKCKLRSEL